MIDILPWTASILPALAVLLLCGHRYRHLHHPQYTVVTKACTLAALSTALAPGTSHTLVIPLPDAIVGLDTAIGLIFLNWAAWCIAIHMAMASGDATPRNIGRVHIALHTHAATIVMIWAHSGMVGSADPNITPGGESIAWAITCGFIATAMIYVARTAYRTRKNLPQGILTRRVAGLYLACAVAALAACAIREVECVIAPIDTPALTYAVNALRAAAVVVAAVAIAVKYHKEDRIPNNAKALDRWAARQDAQQWHPTQWKLNEDG